MDRVKLKCVIKMSKNTLEIIQLIGDCVKAKRVLGMLKITFRSMNPINLNDFSKNIISLMRFPFLHFAYFPNPKNASRVRKGDFDPPHLVVFPKRYFLERVKPCFFMAINIIISLTFSENFSEIPRVFHKI